MLRNIGRRRIARKGVVVGNEVKAIVLGLELEMLAHRAKKVAYMKSAGWLYARKNLQNRPPDSKNTKIPRKPCAKVTVLEANVKDFTLSPILATRHSIEIEHVVSRIEHESLLFLHTASDERLGLGASEESAL
jgi:hypothetical protein